MPTHDFEARVKGTLQTIDESEEIHPDNKELIRDFERDLRLEGLSDAWLQKLTAHLKIIAEHVGDTRFEDMDKDDVKDLVAWVQKRDVSDATESAYKQVIKRFWRWLYDKPKGEHPEETEWVNTGTRSSSNKLPQDLLKEEDIEAQIDACKNARDKAFVAVLWETGARIGELIDVTVGDVEDREHGLQIMVDGKTGPRRLPLVESVPYLSRWLNEHPNPEKDAPLWCKVQQRGPTEKLNPDEVEDVEDVYGIGREYGKKLREAGIKDGRDLVEHDADELADIVSIREKKAQNWLAQLTPDGSIQRSNKVGYEYILRKILKRSMEDAGIDKPSNPHHYRHSRASYMATEMTEAELCKWFGWVQGSEIPAKYVHLSGRDIDSKYNAMHDLIDEDEKDDNETVVECPRCEKLNEPDAKFCYRCGFALERDIAEEMEQIENDATQEATPEELELAQEIAKEIAGNPEKLQSLLEESE
jgi:integrase